MEAVRVPTIGLQHVTVEGDGALAERLGIDHGPEAASDQALNLQGASALFPPGRLAHVARTRWHAGACRTRR